MTSDMLNEEKNVSEAQVGESEGQAPLSSEIDLVAELERVRGEASTHYDRYLRTLADLENLRRRCDKEKSDIGLFANESLMRDLLPVLDSFDRAAEAVQAGSGEGSVKALAEGLELVRRQLGEVLEKNGLAAVDALEQRFDPNLHQAIQREEQPGVDEERVTAQFSKGYTLRGRLLRPAIVTVAVPAASSAASLEG